MSEWDKRIREHKVWAEMKSLGPVIDEVSGMEGLTTDELGGLERLRTILAFTGKRLAAADPFITGLDPLEEISIGFAAAREEITKLLSDKDTSHIRQANAQADAALVGANKIIPVQSSEELGSLIASVEEYRSLIESNLSSARQSNAELRLSADTTSRKLDALAASVEAEQQKVTQVVVEHQRQFSESQEKRAQDFADALTQKQQELLTVITDYQSQFSTAQDARGKEFADAQGTRQEKFNDISAQYTKRLLEQDAEFLRQQESQVKASTEQLGVLNTEYRDKASGILRDVDEEKRRIEKLVGVIGNLGVTSGYLLTANHARRSMWFWQFVTVAAMITLSVLAFRTLPILEDSKGQFNWGGFAGRVLLLGSLGVIAAYGGSQADKLFDVEKRNRKLALELEAIGPYLAPLPEEEQNKFRVQIGDRSFGRDDVAILGVKKSPATLLDLLKSKEGKEIIDLIVEIARKGKP
jgi:hypothetical protein